MAFTPFKAESSTIIGSRLDTTRLSKTSSKDYSFRLYGSRFFAIFFSRLDGISRENYLREESGLSESISFSWMQLYYSSVLPSGSFRCGYFSSEMLWTARGSTFPIMTMTTCFTNSRSSRITLSATRLPSISTQATPRTH